MILLVIVIAINDSSYCQVYFTKNARVSFFSKAILQDIQADNNQVISVLNIQTGIIQFSLLNNAFHFPKAKMEEDFNEDFMESDKYPKSTFNGIIAGINKIDFETDGTWQVIVKGELMIHGVTKIISTPGIITIRNGKISATSTFKVYVKDYNIKIPTIFSNKISEMIAIAVDCAYEKK